MPGIFKSVGLLVNSVDLSDHCTSVSLTETFDSIDVTSVADTHRKTVPGLGAGSFDATFFTSYESGKTYATLQPLAGGTTSVSVEPDSGTTTAATNPTFTATVSCEGFTYLVQDVGTVSTFDISWPLDGSITITTT